MKREELITLSREEHDRYLIVRKVMKGEISQVEAADLLNISDRHVRTLIDKVRMKGAGRGWPTGTVAGLLRGR